MEANGDPDFSTYAGNLTDHARIVKDLTDEESNGVFRVAAIEDADADFEVEDEEGYEDIEDDQEKLTVVSLLDNAVFDDVSSMLEYVATKYHFNLVQLQKNLKLDFFGMVKLVNYVRDETRNGRASSLDITTAALFEDERYLQPVLEDDPLLYSLEDVIESGLDIDEDRPQITVAPPEEAADGHINASIGELHLRVLHAQATLQNAEAALKDAEGIDKIGEGSPGKSADLEPAKPALYHGNYDGAELHRIMISDKVRTEAYRNYISENKQLFKGKTVLDVGCGTGILSLFCADAGAKMVIGVDQSNDIAQKASEIVFRNNKQDVIRIIHGKIQEVVLPLVDVDIIISEWMGYGLLFEAMLDSVIYARDKYLKPNGLMVPDHASLFITPFVDSEYVKDRLGYWDDVYGYDMSCMRKELVQEAEVSAIDACHSVSTPHHVEFMTLDLAKAKVSDLSFSRRDLFFQFSEEVECLDGFVVHFDIRFSDSSGFSTAPNCEQTHWKQLVLLIDRQTTQEIGRIEEGQKLTGQIGYQKEGPGLEGFDIGMEWVVDAGTRARQVWLLR